MSFPEMLGGGAECGPVNPLQQLGKRFGQDRGTQFDGHGAVGGDARHAGFRTTRPAPAQDPAFFAREAPDAGAPFEVHQLRSALPAMDKGVAYARPAPAAPASAATPAWARDFLHHHPASASAAPAPAHAPQAAGPTTKGPAPFAPRYGMQPGAFRPPHWYGAAPMSMMPATQHTAAQSTSAASSSTSSWDTAFTAVDAQQRAAQAAQAAPLETLPSEAELGAMGADELAETAARLLSSVEHDQSEKFQQSEFLQLMRKLRDRQAEVQGASIVDKGKGKAPEASDERAHVAPTRAELDSFMASRAAELRAPAPAAAHAARTADPDEGYSELQAFWAQEDAARAEREQAEREQAEAQRRDAFVGDGGDVGARMREDDAMAHAAGRAANDDPIAAEFHKWNSLGANVSATAPGWEEDMMRDPRAHETDEDQDFVGRAWTGMQGRGQMGAQEREWAQLQSDWDEFEAREDGIAHGGDTDEGVQTAFPYAAPAYRFHENNPYRSRTHQHAMHAPAASHEDSVLEHEAAVQADPGKAEAWYNLGLRQQENERETQAIAALRKAVALDPHLKDAWLALAVSYTNENDRSAALESIERWIASNERYAEVVRKHAPRTDDRHKRLTSLLMAMARSGLGDAPLDADVQVALGVLFNSCSEFDKAVDCFSAALSARPDDWLLYNRIGATLSNSGRSRESLEYYHQALSLRPGFARCHFNLSISCLNLKMYRDAAEHAYTALTLQHASDEERAPEELRGAQNRSLWEILRVSLELLQRPDLARKCETRDINALQLEEIVGM
ncbi:hypothetical protein MBRA1_002212 [Malassezia brasiliensis]|uniref:Peroxisomal targeting signal receptor n=1 Tax=Malassezia brasiliensis TaxID=1821822 RepID=A0AAF0DT38_9BASI|nr:hypothetical protein MBRA1_002212 [Malassezia brasiliensis]